APLSLRVPLIELAVQHAGALGHHGEVGAKRFVLHRTLQFPVLCRHIVVVGRLAASELFGNNVPGQLHGYKSSARSFCTMLGAIAASRSSINHSRLRPSATRGRGYSFPTRLRKSSTVVSPQYPAAIAADM